MNSTSFPREPTLRELHLHLQEHALRHLVLEFAGDEQPRRRYRCSFSTSLIGYTLAKFAFRGRNVVFIAILTTLMIPTEMLIIPWYLMAKNFGWLNTLLGNHVSRA